MFKVPANGVNPVILINCCFAQGSSTNRLPCPDPEKTAPKKVKVGKSNPEATIFVL